MINLLSTGEFAYLAGTTKRTIQWYDRIGILKPKKVLSNGFRFFSQTQILDFQKIFLLTNLGIPLKEISSFVKEGGKVEDLFEAKKENLKAEIDTILFNYAKVKEYTRNLKENRTFIKPDIKVLKPFGIYYFDTECAYVEIESYCKKLASMFTKKGSDFTTLAIFENPTYQPKKSKIKIACLAKKGIRIKKEFEDQVKYLKFNPGKVITYTHNGKGRMLSLMWKQLEKYCRLNQITVRKNTPDFEIYRKVNNNPAKQFFEIYLPIS